MLNVWGLSDVLMTIGRLMSTALVFKEKKRNNKPHFNQSDCETNNKMRETIHNNGQERKGRMLEMRGSLLIGMTLHTGWR